MTNEEKQALIEYCEEVISAHVQHGGDFNEEQVFRLALAALTAQTIGRVDRGAATDSNEYPDARVVCLHEHVGWEAFQDGCEVFTRPAPAVRLAELLPQEISWEEAKKAAPIGVNVKHFQIGANWMLSAILRNIEEAK